MSALSRMSAAYGRMTGLRASTNASRKTTMTSQVRGVATDEATVKWSQYRSGDKTLQEWIEGNREYVAFGFFAFYMSLLAYQLRPGKKKKTTEGDAANASETSQVETKSETKA